MAEVALGSQDAPVKRSKGGSKPGERRGGRKKGTPNKMTASLKEMILTALDEAGGKEYLVNQAMENPASFLTLIGKVLPTTLTGPDEGPLQHDHNLVITFRSPDK